MRPDEPKNSGNLRNVLDSIEKSLKDLKLEYEQFFAGELRREPLKKRSEIKRFFLKATFQHIANTSLKFRLQSLQGTFSSYQGLWDRINYQIELGVYQPHLARAEQARKDKIRLEQKAEARKKSENKRWKTLFNQYQDARRKTSAAGSVSYENFRKSLQKQLPTLQKRLGIKVQFKVVVEEGKVKVKGVKSA